MGEGDGEVTFCFSTSFLFFLRLHRECPRRRRLRAAETTDA